MDSSKHFWIQHNIFFHLVYYMTMFEVILKISFFWLGQKSAIMDLANYVNFPKGEKLSYNGFENYNISWSHFNQNLTWVQICKVMQKICIIPPDYKQKQIVQNEKSELLTPCSLCQQWHKYHHKTTLTIFILSISMNKNIS